MTPRIRAGVARLERYDPSEVFDQGAAVRAHRNENAIGSPAAVVEALRSLGARDYAQYPGDRYTRLLDALSRRFALEAERFAIGNGADDILSALAEAYLEEGDNVVLVEPTFGMYARNAVRRGALVRSVPYRTRWRVDAGDLLAACDERTKMVMLATPNNPTGDSLPPVVAPRLLEALPDTLIVLDEVYAELTGRTSIGMLRAWDNLAVVGSFSKVPGLAGLRVGYVAGSVETAGAVTRVLAPHSLNVAGVVAATAYLEGGEETLAFVRAYRNQVARSLSAIAAACAPLAKTVYKGDANFLLVEFGARLCDVVLALERAGIRAREVEGGGLDGALRLTALDDQGTAAVVAALGQVARAGAASPAPPQQQVRRAIPAERVSA